eukprot:748195-Hanusia_phi.AAC.8
MQLRSIAALSPTSTSSASRQSRRTAPAPTLTLAKRKQPSITAPSPMTHPRPITDRSILAPSPTTVLDPITVSMPMTQLWASDTFASLYTPGCRYSYVVSQKRFTSGTSG